MDLDEARQHQHPLTTTGFFRDGDGTYRCDLCGDTFNGRYLHHFCDGTPTEEDDVSEPDVIGTPDIEIRPERINLREGTIIRIVSGGSKRWPVDPPFIVPEDGYYRAIVDTSNETATMERVYPPNRWASFTDDEIKDLAELMEYGPMLMQREVQAELERRKA